MKRTYLTIFAFLLLTACGDASTPDLGGESEGEPPTVDTEDEDVAPSDDEDTELESSEQLPGRYASFVFESVSVERDVPFGAKDLGDGEKMLLMDVYTGEGDTAENRPLIVYAHGSAGTKEGPAFVGEFFAKSGYVFASIGYDAGSYPNTEEGKMLAVLEAMHDMKAAVRFFRDSAPHWGVDPNNIFIGGYSRGAGAALHHAYIDQEEVDRVAPQELQDFLEAKGGLEGRSGTPGVSSEVKGVINIAGALYSAQAIDSDEPIIVSVHGSDDEVVPIRGSLGREGSILIHEAADAAGITNRLEVVEGAEHVFLRDCEECLPAVREFLSQNLGEPQAQCGRPASTPTLELTPDELPASVAVLEGATFYEDLAYGDAPRMKFDIILPESSVPTPLLIYVHGGGFKGGDKSKWYESVSRAETFFDAGIAMATINYHLLAQDGTETDGVLRSMSESRRALQYFRRHAVDFNIDPDRVGLAGGSAGAGTVMWIGLQDEACDPGASDPVERMSTRVSAIAAVATQATYDLVRWETDVFAPKFPQVTLESIIALEPSFLPEIAAFYGQGATWSDLSPLEEEPVLSYRKKVDMLAMPDASDPPLYLWNGGDTSIPTTENSLLHHPEHAVAMYEAAVSAGMARVELQTRDRNEGTAGDWMTFMLEEL